MQKFQKKGKNTKTAKVANSAKIVENTKIAKFSEMPGLP